MGTEGTRSRGERLPAFWRWLIVAAVVIVFFLAFPPVRIVSFNPERAAGPASAAVFDAEAFADRFWEERLMPHLDSATPLSEVLSDLAEDPGKAVDLHARKVGVGTTAYFFVQGEGEVVAVESNRTLVNTDAGQVALRLGPIFGNAVRDASGLLGVNDVPGIAEFNAVSASLNLRVEQQVIPEARAVSQAGARISFVGCAPASESVEEGPALTLVPLRVEVLP